jgi:histidine triad (HIT) family protein
VTDAAPDCLFCRIAAREIPTEMLHESDEAIAFRDISPQAPTHVLVIPRRHVPSADALVAEDAPLLAGCFAALRAVARSEGLEGGYRIVTNTGHDAGQSVQHLHFHLLGGRRMGWPPG